MQKRSEHLVVFCAMVNSVNAPPTRTFGGSTGTPADPSERKPTNESVLVVEQFWQR
jgi:hypothetical protein